MRRPRDLAEGMRAKRDRQRFDDGFTRETFTLPVEAARAKAREILDRFPVGGYATIVERWRNSMMAGSNSRCVGCRRPTDPRCIG